jgi:hypothetical protein
MSMQNKYELRVDLADWEGNTSYAVYDLFEVGDEVSYYRNLTIIILLITNVNVEPYINLQEQRTQPVKW